MLNISLIFHNIKAVRVYRKLRYRKTINYSILYKDVKLGAACHSWNVGCDTPHWKKHRDYGPRYCYL